MNGPSPMSATMQPVTSADAKSGLEAVYAAGHWLLSCERIAEAAVAFCFMLRAAPTDERGWLGLGQCHERILQPFVMDIIDFYDQIEAQLNYIAARTTGVQPQDQLTNLLHAILQGMVTILARHGIEIFTTALPTFQHEEQKVIQVVTTDNLAQDMHIHRRLRKGFRYQDRVIRPEWVEIYRFQSLAT